jgi:N-acetylmuramoyl-L-alanine amidase
VSELAARLELDVVDASERGATLRNSANTVSLFPDPRGRAFVNGNPVGQEGGITAVHGVIHVPATLEQAIRAALLPGSAAEIETVGTSPVRPRPPTGRRPAAAGPVVVIDAGHGGHDPGTPRKLNGIIDEKAVNLDCALRVERILKASGVRVLLTRRTDVFVDLDARPAFGNRHRARLFVSLHADSAENRSAEGFTVYIARKATRGSQQAAAIMRRELARTGVKDRGIHRQDFRVVRKSRGPSMLVELGFLSNRREARRLATSSYRERMAQAIARGVLAFLRSP